MRFNESFLPDLGNSPEVTRIVQQVANQVASAARASAPVDTGEYRSSIHVEMDHTPYRVVARVVASSDHAMLVESKTGNLRRALNGAARG